MNKSNGKWIEGSTLWWLKSDGMSLYGDQREPEKPVRTE